MKHYKRFLLLMAMLSVATFVSAQPFIQKQINRRVSDYDHVGIDQSSPLSYYLSRAYIMAEGKMGLMAKMSTVKFELDTCEVDVVVDSAKKQRILDEKIIKIVIYKDSVAAIVTEYSENWQIFSEALHGFPGETGSFARKVCLTANSESQTCDKW